MKRLIASTLMASITIALAACGDSASQNTTADLVKNAALGTTTTPARATPTTVRQAGSTTTAIPALRATTTTTMTTVPATGPNTCSSQGPCTVGQIGPAGGIVFYAAPTPQKWGRFMEVRPEAFEQITPDTCNLDAYDSYATGKIGDGLTQTVAIIAACAKDGVPKNAGSYARVSAYTKNGYRGWFVPSKDELKALADSRVIKFPVDKDLTSGTWAQKPRDSGARGFDVVWGIKKETLSGTSAASRGGTVMAVEIMSDGPQSYGNPNNRWGMIYIARAFGPAAK